MNSEQLRHFIGLSSLPMWVLDPETQTLLAVNDAALELYGYAEGEFLAISPDALPLGHEHDGEAIRHPRRDGSSVRVSCVQQEIHYQGRPAVLAIVQPVEKDAKGAPSIAVQESAEPIAAADRERGLAGIRLLIVDDDSNTREMLEILLASQGALTQVAGSVADALRLLQTWRPALIVSDMSMPGEDGYDLIREVRALPVELGGRTPAIALTGYTSDEDRARALALGYQSFVTKPLELQALIFEIQSVQQGGQLAA